MPAQTARTPGDGTGTLAYTLTSDSFDVESVYVTIDNVAGATDVTAELTIQDQSGVVIARKKQAGTIAAGTAGSATWALRLDDEGSGGTPPVAVTAHEELQGNAVSIADSAIGNLTWDTSFGPDSLLDLTNPALPLIKTAGVYAVMASFAVNLVTAGGGYFADLEIDTSGPVAHTAVATAAITSPGVVITAVYYSDVNQPVRARVFNQDGVAARSFSLANATVQRLS